MLRGSLQIRGLHWQLQRLRLWLLQWLLLLLSNGHWRGNYWLANATQNDPSSRRRRSSYCLRNILRCCG